MVSLGQKFFRREGRRIRQDRMRGICRSEVKQWLE